MGQSNTKQAATKNQIGINSSSSINTIASVNDNSTHFKAKNYLSKVEYVSMKLIFNELKSSFIDHFECIELKQFLEFLNLPPEIEPSSILLFKSLSYLGSYPAHKISGPVPLSFDSFITAFVVLAGRLDKPDNPISENLFFQSLSVLPAPDENESDEVTSIEQEQEEEGSTNVEDESVPNRHSRGLSLAELGIDFDDLDLDTKKDTEKLTNQGPEILCRDLIEIFVLLLWLGEADKDIKHDFKKIIDMAKYIVYNIKSVKTLTNNNTFEANSSVMDDEYPCISYELFCRWKNRFSTHLFKSLQSFITRSFTYYDGDTTSTVPRSARFKLLPEDKVPEPIQSDILIPLYTTLLSWLIPENILVTKQWLRLYSADQNGFSMNRFESHVFKYPGPTLFILEVDAVSSSCNAIVRQSSEDCSKWSETVNNNRGEKKQIRQTIILGAYVAQPWKHSKQFWGTNECFLFELYPSFDVFRPVIKNHTKDDSKNDHYIYYHHDFGIGFGAMNKQPPLARSVTATTQQNDFIIFLQNSLQEGIYQVEAYPPQPSFESMTESRKNSSFFYKFNTVNIEVFGLGNEKDREKQLKEWKFEKQEAARRSGVNIRHLDGQLDKELLKMAGIINEDMRQDR